MCLGVRGGNSEKFTHASFSLCGDQSGTEENGAERREISLRFTGRLVWIGENSLALFKDYIIMRKTLRNPEAS